LSGMDGARAESSPKQMGSREKHVQLSVPTV
jgi:hypothetical protein